MRINDKSSNSLIKISNNLREEITRDVLESFGIDLSKQNLAYHDKTKPVWTQQILDNKSLKKRARPFFNNGWQKFRIPT